jgi:SAM-dependent methyltransferase
MKVLKSIIQINRKASNAFEKKFPIFKCPDFTRPMFKETVEGFISRENENGRKLKILEVGSVDRPFLKRSDTFEYHGLDIEPIDGAEEIYDRFLVQSIEDNLDETYDLIISRMVLEHVPDNTKSWQVMYDALKSNAVTVHIFPGSRHPFSIATRIVGNRIQRILIRYLRPNAKHTGYPAYYHLCSPIKLRKKLLEIGFKNIQIRHSYSANDYFKFFFPAYFAIAVFNLFMTKFGIDEFASNFYVEAEK